MILLGRGYTYPSAIYPQTDVRLVTTNAKLFNPPGTIYHSEAERIETYAIDHINKAAANVIEYETDWNIDIEHDDNGLARLDDDDERSRDAGTPMDVDGSTRGRSPSVASTQTPLNGHLPRRGGKGSSKKQPGMLSESLEPGGHLPGYKDGVGLFPSDSNWAALMLSLKLKGMILHSPFDLGSHISSSQALSDKERENSHGEGWSTVQCGWQSRLYRKSVLFITLEIPISNDVYLA